MKKKRTKRESQAFTIRLDADSVRIVQFVSSETNWSHNVTVGRLLVAGWAAVRGHPNEAAALRELVEHDARVHAADREATQKRAELAAGRSKLLAKIRPPHIGEITRGA